MKIRKSQASLAARLWVLATVFVLHYFDYPVLAAWLVLGAALGLLWYKLPPEPPGPPERLPYQK